MTTGFKLGFQIGSFLKGIFHENEPIKKEPVLYTEPIINELELLKKEQRQDIDISRIKAENEIKTTIEYQKKFLDHLTYFYLQHHPFDSIDEVPEEIRNSFKGMYQNFDYIEYMISQLDDIDLLRHENEGFTEVAILINKIKREL
jgi:hypothetical protein